MKKKITAFVLVISMVLSLSACAAKELPQQGSTEMHPNSGLDTEGISSDNHVSVSDDGYDAESANAAAADFAVRLFQKSLEMEQASGQDVENILISPASVLTALAMTTNGAKGETLAQMEETLGLNAGQLNRYFREYMAGLPEEAKMANSIWFTDDEEFTVKEEFLQLNEDYYDADIYKTAFDEGTLNDINAWVEEKTDGLIKEILNEIPEGAVMYLINALVFDAQWEETYSEDRVREGTFTLDTGLEQTVDMMYSEESLYLEDENAIGFIKHYEGRRYAFAALLPKEGISIYDYVNSLSGEDLQALLSNPTEVHVNAWLPQFETEYNVEMSDVLIEMGMTEAFDKDKADLSGLGTSSIGNIWVDRVIHKTYIEVGAQGTKAGAATAAEIQNESAIIEDMSKDVRLDRPFIYMIIDCENNQPLFMGIVYYVNPYLCGYPPFAE